MTNHDISDSIHSFTPTNDGFNADPALQIFKSTEEKLTKFFKKNNLDFSIFASIQNAFEENSQV